MKATTRAWGTTESKDLSQVYPDVRRKARRAAAIYFMVCSVYIIVSSALIFYVDTEIDTRAIEIAKGLTFVVITSAILYILLHRLLLKSAQSTLRLRRIIDSMHDVVLILDWNSRRILDCNPAVERVIGYKPSELIGGTTQLLHIDPEHFEAFGRISNSVMSGEGRYLGEFQLRRRNGEAFAAGLSIGTFVDDSGKTIGIALIRDISEQKQLEEKLRVSQRLKAIGQITAGVAHDFNNHLTVILSSLSLADDSPALTGDSRSRVEVSLQAARRAAQLATTLSTSARNNTRTPVVTNLRDAVMKTMALLERTVAANIKLVTEDDSSLVSVLLDPGLLEDAVLNLAINACDAMPDGGTLTISVRKQELNGDPVAGVDGPITSGTYGVLAVSDTGVGIPPEYLEAVIEPFFTTKGPGEGTGLGLSMIHEFMRKSKGYMRIRSTVGEGTTVELFFPITPS
ncbi:MAG: nitrogen regulation protein NR(II) [Rhodospirillaceae bacterium]